MSEEYEGSDPEQPNDESEAGNSRGRFRPRITHRLRRTDADGDAAQFKGRVVRRKGYTP